MTKTVLGVFTEREKAEDAIGELKDAGYNPEDISIVMKDTSVGEEMAEDTGASTAEGAVSGATTGLVLGGLAGLAASFVLPGLGAFFIGGPIASALGLTGAAASTVSGAATGLVAGGILGALTGFGLSEDEARDYEERINEGAILLAIPARSGEESRVEQILSNYEADDIKSVTPREDRFEKRSTSRHAVDMHHEEQMDEDMPHHHVASGAKGGHASSGSKSKKGKGRGWHGDPEGHSMAGRGKDVPGRGEGK